VEWSGVLRKAVDDIGVKASGERGADTNNRDRMAKRGTAASVDVTVWECQIKRGNVKGIE